MGFFKKIGQSIKKNVSFKNLVKVATTAVGFVPGVGGIAQQLIGKVTDSVEAKKLAKEAEAQGKQAEADYWNAQTKALEQSSANTVGAVSGAGSSLLVSSALDGAFNGVSQGAKQSVANAGATVVSLTLKVWFEKNWKIVVGAVCALIALIWFIRSDRNNSGKRVAKKR